MTANTRYEEVEIAVIGKTYCWETLPQSSRFCEETVRLKLAYYLWNTKGITTILLRVRGMAILRYEGQNW